MATPEPPLLQPPPRTRNRASLSCTECRRRKQKCDQAKDKPCNRCVRRYPPVKCIYENELKSSKSGSKKLAQNDPEAQYYYYEDDEYEDEGAGSPFDIEMTDLNLQEAQPLGFLPPFQIVVPSNYESVGMADNHESGRFFSFGHSLQEDGFNPAEYGLHSLPGTSREEQASQEKKAGLLHFFITTLLPYLPIEDYRTQFHTYIHTSSLVTQVSLLASAYFLSPTNVETSVDVITCRSVLIEMINAYLREHETKREGVSDEAILGVLGLSYLEFIYSDKKTVIAHLNGLKSMVTTRGGIHAILPSDGVLRTLLMITDHQIALTFNLSPFLHSIPQTQTQPPNQPTPNLKLLPPHLTTPLLPSKTPFSHSTILDSLHLKPETARLLDDMHFLTASIIRIASSSSSSSSSTNNVQAQKELEKFRKTVGWISTRLKFVEEEEEEEEEAIHNLLTLTAQLYLSCITNILEQNQKQNPQTQTPHLTSRLTNNLSFSLLSRTRMPGVWMWVLLVVDFYMDHHLQKHNVPSSSSSSSSKEEEQQAKSRVEQKRRKVKGLLARSLLEFSLESALGIESREEEVGKGKETATEERGVSHLDEILDAWRCVRLWLSGGDFRPEIEIENEVENEGEEDQEEEM